MKSRARHFVVTYNLTIILIVLHINNKFMEFYIITYRTLHKDIRRIELVTFWCYIEMSVLRKKLYKNSRHKSKQVYVR